MSKFALTLKSHFADLKEKQIEKTCWQDASTWQAQKALLLKARALQGVIGSAQCDDFNGYDDAIKAASKKAGIALGTKEKEASRRCRELEESSCGQGNQESSQGQG